MKAKKKENLDKAYKYLKRNGYFKDKAFQLEVPILKNINIDKIQFYYQGELVDERDTVDSFGGTIYVMAGDALLLRPPRNTVVFSFDLPKGLRAKILKKAKTKGITVEQYIEMVCNDAVLVIGQMDNIDTNG